MVCQKDERSVGPNEIIEKPRPPHFWNSQINTVFVLAVPRVVCGPAVQAWPASSLETKNLRPQPSHTEAESAF